MHRFLATVFLAVIAVVSSCGSNPKDVPETSMPAPTPSNHPAPVVSPVPQQLVEETSIGRLRGLREVNLLVRSKLLSDAATFSLSRYLGSDSSGTFGLGRFLGIYAGDGLTAGYRFIKPTPLGLLLWRLTIQSFAADIAKHCSGSSTVPLSQFAKDLILHTCTTRSATALWTHVHGSHADTTEANAFIELNSAISELSAEAFVAESLVAILYHPTVILEY
jgi:hypothetical protein